MKTQEDFSQYNGDGTVLRKAQLRMLAILIEVDKICRKHNISYWLDYGTLLGAVRHQGFIPWDDDLDICVLRKDYKRLRKVLIAELPKQYLFLDWKNDAYFFDPCGRIKDTQTRYSYSLFYKQASQGLWIDIIMLEKVPNFQYKKVVDRFYGPVFRQLHNVAACHNESQWKCILKKSMAGVLFPFAQLLVWLGRFLAMVNPYSFYAHTYGLGFYAKRSYDDIFPLKTISFENHDFPCPNNVDACLINSYGDYMQLPPEETRMGHNVSIEIFS